ncbi:hypothetical protein PMI07_002056 [Rhizobium sp. CF080]|uniref:hypothetical protein n=1 Tax=Rhizobium sp. (strain CF080) TaxID=1144310 RepID=UPI000271CE0C|nr:hypothetical protein [Rhizobium sp. CF080]EUB95568.1 hypothetical protein PMI07_002056 [Rhizobium sp. CF080]
MNERVIITTRRRLEAKIEELIDLLDMVDGDPDLEENGDAEPEETDEDGDEQDCSHTEDEWSPYAGGSLQFDGSGVDVAEEMIRNLRIGQRPRLPDRALEPC